MTTPKIASQAVVTGKLADLAVTNAKLANNAAGLYSSAAGRRAKTDHSGSFVWADGNDFDFRSSADNQLRARTTGARSSSPRSTAPAPPPRAWRSPRGGSAWGALSDAASKENVQPISEREVLRKLASIPASTWSYKAQDDSIRHIGPMAQDFYEAFGVGEDPRRITTIDADGVALAAVQGLNERLERENARLRRTLASTRRGSPGSKARSTADPRSDMSYPCRSWARG